MKNDADLEVPVGSTVEDIRVLINLNGLAAPYIFRDPAGAEHYFHTLDELAEWYAKR